MHRVILHGNYLVTFPAVAIFRFNPNAYTVAEDVGTLAVSLELISGTLSFNSGVQISVTGGTVTVGVLPAGLSKCHVSHAVAIHTL